MYKKIPIVRRPQEFQAIKDALCSVFDGLSGFSPAYRIKTQKILQSVARRVIVSVVLLWKYQGAAQNGRRLAYTTRKGVERMPITITFHVFTYTITITVKSKNRHSAK